MNIDHGLYTHMDSPENKTPAEELLGYLEEFQNFFEGVDISSPESIKQALTSNPDKFISITRQLHESLKQIETNTVGNEEEPDQRLLEKWTGHSLRNPNNPFFRIQGLVDHDIKKSYAFLKTYLSLTVKMLKSGTIPSGMEEILVSDIPPLLNMVPEAISMLKLLEKFKNQNYDIGANELLVAIGFRQIDETHFVLSRLDKGDLTISLESNFTLDTPEKLFTMSTLIINAKHAATLIKVRTSKDSVGEYIEVWDDIAGGTLPQDYIDGQDREFKKGLARPTDPLLTNTGGGKLAAYLAGQRLALTQPLSTLEDKGQIFEIIYDDSSKTKGFKIYFPDRISTESLQGLGINYYIAKIQNLAEKIKDGITTEEQREIVGFIDAFKESRLNFFDLIEQSSEETFTKNNIEAIRNYFNEIYDRLHAEQNVTWENIPELMRFLELVVIVHTSNDFSSLKERAELEKILGLPTEDENVA